LVSHSQALEHDSGCPSLPNAPFSNSDRSPSPAELDDAVALQAIAEGTAQSTGAEFFQKLVQHLARALGVDYAMVAEFVGENRVRTLAYWQRERIADNVESPRSPLRV
jgi:formate hydrogenlyase transcriptional activator